MLYLIAYEIKNKIKDYAPLYQKIKDYGIWMHYIDNVWIIESTKDVVTINNEIYPLIDQQLDYLFIVNITRDYQGFLPKDAWDWINERNFN